MAEQLNNNHTFRHGMIPACAMMSVGIVSVITSLDKRPTVQFSSVKSLSCVQLCNPMSHSTPGLPVHHQFQSLPKAMSIESVMPSNHLILCCPLLLLPSISPSIKVFTNELALGIRWSKYWCFNFNISLFNEYSGLISFRIDWFDLFAVQGTLKSLHHHTSKASILQLTFFMVQLSYPHMITGKVIVFTK